MTLKRSLADLYAGSMKRCIVIGLILACWLRAAPAEVETFIATLSQADLAALGLAELTPAQRARLNALVEDYKRGTITSARRAAAEALAAQQAAEAQTARAEKRAEAARLETAKAEARQVEAVKIELGKSTGGSSSLTKAKESLKPAASSENLVIESSILGSFRGWEPRQVFTLANGQRWQVANRESYYSPVVENPKIVIVPAAIAGYWMRFPAIGAEVRVNLVSEK